MRYIDLFAGCGGLSLGFHDAGWDGLFAIEKDPMAFDTLSANMLDEKAPYPHFSDWPEWLPQQPHDIYDLVTHEGIRTHLSKLRGSVDLVAGGPPCQGFSVGGARNGADQRNLLVGLFLEVVDLVRPRAVLIENVEGMSRRFESKPGLFVQSPVDHVVEVLGRLGYAATTLVVDASLFGVPQLRRRLIVVGVSSPCLSLRPLLEDHLRASRLTVLESQGLSPGRLVTALEALEDLDGARRVTCPDSPKYEAGTYKGKPHSPYAKSMRHGILASAIPDSHRFSKHGDRILGWYELAHRTQPPGRLSKDFMVSLGTKKDKKVLIDPHAPVSTITTHPDEFIHYRHPRNVTVREMARLQSFPDDFAFRGRYTINGPRRRFDVARCSQVGNAVPPLMAQGIARALESLLSDLSPPASARHAAQPAATPAPVG